MKTGSMPWKNCGPAPAGTDGRTRCDHTDGQEFIYSPAGYSDDADGKLSASIVVSTPSDQAALNGILAAPGRSRCSRDSREAGEHLVAAGAGGKRSQVMPGLARVAGSEAG